MDVTLRDLRYFLALAGEEHLGRAADQLAVAPATLSEGVKRLERATGVELFARSGRGLVLTDRGRALIGDARRAVDAAAQFESAAEAYTSRAGATIRVGTSVGYGTSWLYEAQQASNTPSLEIVVTGYEDPTAGLSDGNTQAAIVGGPCAIDHQLSHVLLGYDPRLAAVAESHPAAQIGSMKLVELDEIGWLDVPSGDQVWHHYWRCDIERGGPPDRISRECRTMLELAYAVASGDGVCTVPKSMVELLKFEGVAFVDLADIPPAPVRLAIRLGNDSRPEFVALAESLRSITFDVLARH